MTIIARVNEQFRRWWSDRVLMASVGMALFMWSVMALAESRNSPTADEYWHLTRGVAAVRAPDTRINHPHPPFAQALAMLPVSLVTKPDFASMRGFPTASMPLTSSSFIKNDYPTGRQYLRAGRLMNAALAAGLLVFMVVWLRPRFGNVAALAAGLLYATCPIVLAHAGLVTNDFGLGAATLLGLAGVYSYLEHGGGRRLLVAAAAAALLPIVKTSGLLIFACLALMPLVWFVRRSGAYAAGTLGEAALRLVRDYAVVALVTLFAVNAVYRFHLTGLTPQELATVGFPEPVTRAKDFNEFTALEHWPSTWPVPLPFTYLRCLEFLSYKDQTGHAGMWFGKYSRSGSPWYFPFMLAGKTQVLLLPLLLAGYALGLRKMLSGVGKWLLLLGAVFLAAAIRSKLNIGVRHVFPTLICLLVLGGRATEVVSSFVAGRWARAAFPLMAAGGFSLVAGVAWSFPAYIGDFNVLVGNELGRRASPVAEDWGQDGAELAREMKRRGLSRVAYEERHSYGRLELENLGLTVKNLRCNGRAKDVDAIAIHLTDWVRQRRCYRKLRRRAPDFTAHDNIVVYWVDEEKGRRTRKPRRTEPAPASTEPHTEATGGDGADEP